MLLDSGERTLVVQAFRSGARGVFCRNDAVEMLARCVHKVHEGQLWVNGPQLEFLLETLATAPATQLMAVSYTHLDVYKRQEYYRNTNQ